MKNVLVVGGASGLGSAIVRKLIDSNIEKIYVVDKQEPKNYCHKVVYIKQNLVNGEYDFTNRVEFEIDAVFITAGVGRLSYFSELDDAEIEIDFRINTFPTIKLIKLFYMDLLKKKNFKFVVVTSIAGILSSPLYALYSSTKAAVHKLIEAINVELYKQGSSNQILEIAPGHLKGTSFHGNETNLNELSNLVEQIFQIMNENKGLFIPKEKEIYKEVIDKYNFDPYKFGMESIDYKLKNARLEHDRKYKIGYLSGTFDLFHIGHLNLIKRAKDYCDYLVVGVHKNGAHKNIETFVSFDERVSIVKSIKYVDRVIESRREDSDVYNDIKFDFLFVGSDYKNSKRFMRYEKILVPLGVKIIYFEYTKGTSSTKLRNRISMKV